MKVTYGIRVYIGLTLMILSCRQNQKAAFINNSLDSSTSVIKIPFPELIRTFKTYHGKYIETEGIFWYQFENVSICPHPGPVWEENYKCFWLDLNNDLKVDGSTLRFASGKRF